MRVHVCLLDKTCRALGGLARLHVSTRRYSYGLALTPGSKFGGGRRWTYLVPHPRTHEISRDENGR